MTIQVETVNFTYLPDEIIKIDKNSFIEKQWNGPIQPNKSYSGELYFNISDKAPSHCMLVSSRSDSVRFGGWNLQIVGNSLGLQIGNGKEWVGISSKVGANVQKNHWHHAAWLIDNTNNKAEMYLDGIKYESSLPSNYIHAKNSVVIGALNSNQPNFRFIGEIKNIKLGNNLVVSEEPPNNEFESFTDTELNISDMNVGNFINVLDQYSSDREWIQQALDRLRQELTEEIDLNNKLKELDTNSATFLVSKVDKFMNDYSIEIKEIESELQQIYTDLQRLIEENSQLMNNNKALKDRMANLNTNGTDQSIGNIRKLIDDNINLLKDSGRWGDTNDMVFKFNNSK